MVRCCVSRLMFGVRAWVSRVVFGWSVPGGGGRRMILLLVVPCLRRMGRCFSSLVVSRTRCLL